MISQLNSIVTWNHVNWPMIHHKSHFATLNNALDKYFDPADFMGTLWQLGTFVPKSFVTMCVAQPHRVVRNADFSKSAQRRVHCWEIHQFQKSKRFGRSWTTRTLVSKKSSGGTFHKYNWKILWGAECEHLYVYKMDWPRIFCLTLSEVNFQTDLKNSSEQMKIAVAFFLTTIQVNYF